MQPRITSNKLEIIMLPSISIPELHKRFQNQLLQLKEKLRLHQPRERKLPLLRERNLIPKKKGAPGRAPSVPAGISGRLS